jgi:protein O-mannosyl-transferase
MTDRVPRDPTRRLPASLCAVALLLAFGVYRGGLTNPFVYDDHVVVVENRSITSLSDIRTVLLHDVKRPLVNVSYALDYALWGLAPFGYHATNLLLHLLNVGLLFAFARRAASDHDERSARAIHDGRELAVAFTAAVLLAVHPLMTQAVGYVAARADLLSATFVLAALLSYRCFVRTAHRRWLILTLLWWLLALSAKETVAMLPPLLALYDWLILSHERPGLRRRILTLHVPMTAAMVVVALLRLDVLLRLEYGDAGRTHWTHLLVEADVLRQYLALLVVPIGQSVFHPVAAIGSATEIRGVFALLWVVALVVVAVRVGKRDRLAALGIAWFVLMLIPPAVLVMFDLGEPMAEHRAYVASLGAFVFAGSAAGWLWSLARRFHTLWRVALCGVLAALVAALGALTLQRNAVWSDPVRLWTEAVDSAPDIWVTHLMLGQELQLQGRCDEAVTSYKRAIALRPQEPFPYLKAGVCLASLGRLQEGTQMFARARALQPQSTRPLIGLGMMSTLAGRPDEARRYFRDAVDMDPDDANAKNALSSLEADVLAAAAARCASLEGRAREECAAGDLPNHAPR